MTPRATSIHLVALAVVAMFLASSPAVAQTGALQGKVIGEDGKPLKDAQIIIERVDIKGTYKVKTKGKGDYFHAGLPLGTYNVSVEVGGKSMETVRGVRTTLGDPREVNFNLQELRAKQQATQQAIESGNLTQDQMRGLTAEQREALEKQMKERAESMKKNKALNEAYNAGMTAFQAKQFEVAIESFAKASEIDPKQQAVWSSLAEAYNGLGKTKAGGEQEAAFNKAVEAYNKAIELNPTEGGYYNNLGLVLVGLKKFDEAQASLEKAAQLEPAKAGMYFYNLGAVLVNTGQIEPAGAAFKRAIEADPKHANAQYQYGIYLISKATTTADGKVIPPPGTREAFQTYIDLDPTGMFADSAKGMIATIDSSVQTEYTNPDAKTKGKKK